MPESKPPDSSGYPLNLIHYSSLALGNNKSLETGISVKDSDIRHAMENLGSNPSGLNHKYLMDRVGSELIDMFRSQILAVIESNPEYKTQNKLSNWTIRDLELSQAIVRIAAEVL